MKVILADGREIHIYNTVVFWIGEGRQSFTLNFGIAVGEVHNSLTVADGAVLHDIHPDDAILDYALAINTFKDKVSKALTEHLGYQETTKRGGTIDKKA